MSPQEYSKLALRTAKDLPHQQQVEHAMLGILSEIGEICDAVKKHTVYGKDLDRINIMEEIGDTYWFINLMCHCYGLSFEGLSFRPISGTLSLNEETIGLAYDLSELSYIVCFPQNTIPEIVRSRLSSLSKRLCTLMQQLSLDLGEVLHRNINKLAARYGDRYSDHCATVRNLDAERIALMNGDAR